MEKVQKRMTRMLPNLKNMSYPQRLEISGLTTLESRDVGLVLEASATARGGLEAVFFSWLGLASASHGLASVLARSGR